MRKFQWFIEAPGNKYLSARHLGRYEFFWTADHNAALRFDCRDQAEIVMYTVREICPIMFAFAQFLGEPKAIEHGWINVDAEES